MTNDNTTQPLVADTLDQLTVRALLAKGEAGTLDPTTVTQVLAEHGRLEGRGSGASFQRVAAAVITHGRNFTLPRGWELAGANVTAGLIAWRNLGCDDLIVDRLFGRGLASFPGIHTLPTTSPGTYLRLCDLTHPEDSVVLRSQPDESWRADALDVASPITEAVSA